MGSLLLAKAATGAASCSLRCANPIRYEKDRYQWVKFTIKDAGGKEATIDRQIVGTPRIKHHDGDFQMLPVIRIGVCLGSLHQETDVNLVDRTGFECPTLIRHSSMANDLVVNPSIKHMVQAACKFNEYRRLESVPPL